MRKRVNKIIILLLVVSMITGMLPVTTVEASGSYASIDYSARAAANRVNMKGQPGFGDCAVASIASIEAYWANSTNGKYDEIYSMFGGVYISSWAKAGYTSQGYSLQTLYNALQSGPVIVHRSDSSGGHYSVVVAYEGNTSTLETSGFKVMEVQRYNRTDGSYGYPTSWNSDYSNAVKVPLDVWGSRSSGNLDQICVRGAGNGSVNTNVISSLSSSEVSDTTAKITASLNGTYYVTTAGFYLGTDASNMTRVNEDIYKNANTIFYGLGTGKWTQGLSPQTTYYYQIYATVGGTEYKSEVGSFTTAADANVNTRLKTTGVTNLGETSAQINASLSPGARVSEIGFYYGKSPDSMQRVVESTTTYVESIWYQLGTKWTSALEKGTTYYYQIYAIIDGVTYKTAVDCFTTLGDVQLPVVTNVYYTDVTEEGYTVYCDVTDNIGIERVCFPTWTEANGQDDIAGDWYNTTAVKTPVSGKTYCFRVNTAEHNYETGVYITHIYAYDVNGNYALGDMAIVTIPKMITNISLNQTSANLEVGKTLQLTATVSPSDASNKTVIYTSSDSDIATVSENGLVTAQKAGTVTIIASAWDGSGKTAACTVTVTKTESTGNSGTTATPPQNGWYEGNGTKYWYENGIRQGTYSDPKGVIGDNTVRGREIYDPESDGWYWLDAVYNGAKAVNKEVWMPYIYQNEADWDEAEIAANAAASGDMAQQVINEINHGSGKWVRYDSEGKMYKGWYTVEGEDAKIYPDQVGNTYYYDPKTGLMAKGTVKIDGETYYFNEVTGVLQE